MTAAPLGSQSPVQMWHLTRAVSHRPACGSAWGLRACIKRLFLGNGIGCSPANLRLGRRMTLRWLPTLVADRGRQRVEGFRGDRQKAAQRRLLSPRAASRKEFTSSANCDAYWYKKPCPESGNKWSCALAWLSRCQIKTLFSVGRRTSWLPVGRVRRCGSQHENQALTVCNKHRHSKLIKTIE